jgi:hypothetical protein
MADFFESTIAGMRMAAKAGKSRAGTSEYCSFCGRSVHGITSAKGSRVTGLLGTYLEIDPNSRIAHPPRSRLSVAASAHCRAPGVLTKVIRMRADEKGEQAPWFLQDETRIQLTGVTDPKVRVH